jgi:uncharacterized protein (TIRG00374 family)
VAICVPTLPPIVRRFALIGLQRVNAPGNDEDANDRGNAKASHHQDRATSIETSLTGVNYRLLLEGWIASFVCWTFLGLSLWATLHAIGVENVRPIRDLPRLVAAVALAVVAGFVSMLPGGLGVRDLALVQLLAENCGPADALVATVLLRLVWLVSESSTCVILYIAAKLKH